MTPLPDAVAWVRVVAGIKRAMGDNEAADALATILAALPTPEERDSIDVAAQVMLATDYFDADSKRLRAYLNRTRTGGVTDGE